MLELFVNSVIHLHTQPLLLYFLASAAFLFIGEPVVLAFSTLSASYDLISPFYLTLLAFLTAVAAELFWYYVGKTKFLKKIFPAKKSQQLDALLRRFGTNQPFILLFVARFFTGLSILAIIHVSRRGMKISDFLKCSILVNIIWTPVMVALGYLAGKGYLVLVTTVETVRVAATIFIIVMAIVYGVYFLLKRHLQKKAAIS